MSGTKQPVLEGVHEQFPVTTSSAAVNDDVESGGEVSVADIERIYRCVLSVQFVSRRFYP